MLRILGAFCCPSPEGNASGGSPSGDAPIHSAAAKRYTETENAIQPKASGALKERGEIRKESLRGNLKRGERISDEGALLAPLLWFPLRICAPRPAKLYNRT